MIFNRVKSKLTRLSRSGELTIFQGLLRDYFARAYTNQYIRLIYQRLKKRKDPEGIIFLCGCFNSGTTILREVIGSHPLITSMPREGVVFTDKLSDYEEGEWSRLICDDEEIESRNRSDFRKLTKDDLLQAWNPWIHSDKWLLEKSISNSLRMTCLQKIFPDARFIIVERDPYGPCEGLIRRSRRIKKGSQFSKPSLGFVADQWCRFKLHTVSQSKELDNAMVVRYEDFLEDPVKSVEEIFRWVGIEAKVKGNKNEVVVNEVRWDIVDTSQKSLDALGASGINEINNVVDKWKTNHPQIF